jgi:hypothetical protein
VIDAVLGPEVIFITSAVMLRVSAAAAVMRLYPCALSDGTQIPDWDP